MITHVVPTQLIPPGVLVYLEGPNMSAEDGAILSQFLAENDFVVTLAINPIAGGTAFPQD